MSHNAPIGLRKLSSPIVSQIMPYHNPIQLAALSNYKLAQLTFAPPDLHSLRKTAVIKNMLHVIYVKTPPEWLQQMTRWQYFTPESLEEMTQEGLEQIFAQYVQTIDAFRPINNSQPYDDDTFDDDDGHGDDLWLAEDEPPSSAPPIDAPSLFSQPNATLSNESIDNPIRAPSPLSDKPLPANPLISDDTAKQARRRSSFGMNKNRLSWTSDTGVTSGVVSQNLANEIMSLFDMDFAVDIKLNTAPRLPELPFKHKRRSHRQSQDMLATLLPVFDKIASDNSNDPSDYSFVPLKNKPNLIIQPLPKRSSSLRHKQTTEEPSPPTTPDTSNHKSHFQKTPLRRIASLMTGGKKSSNKEPNTPESPVHLSNSIPPTPPPHHTLNTPRKASTSTIDSVSSSSSWSNVSEHDSKLTLSSLKPLPEPPKSPDLLPFVALDDLKASKSSLIHKKKRRSLMEKTLSTRKSAQNLLPTEMNTPQIGRSKSTFIKIGNGLKSKSQVKQIRRTSSAKNLSKSSELYTHFPYHTSSEVNEIYQAEADLSPSSTNSFVKRITTFNWRMKSRSNKSIEV
ncbi:hypothetical protein BDB01DRAFT_783374 [Pilobolus umbonatus]|nr:hypothetical protein BDB01DRAFT_783374 [Pilobolus umbonatus]